MKTKKTNLIFAIAMMVIFVIFTIIIKTVDVAAIGPEGTAVGLSSINGPFHDIFDFNETYYKISEVLGIFSLMVCATFGCVGLLQLIKGKSLAKVDKDIWVLAGFYVIVMACYVLFEKVVINYRPVILDEGLEASYPSSHTILSLCVLSSAVYMFERYLKEKKLLKNILSGLFIVLAVLTVISRAFSGVHWLTDIIGGVLLSLALLNFFVAFLLAGDKQ